jgi:ribonuclease HII
MTRWTLTELRARFVRDGRPLPRALEAELRTDPRPGARSLLADIEARRRARRAEGQRRRRLLRHERALWTEGRRFVAGVDEAGMSPWAGPVVAAAVVLPEDFDVPGIDDSKRLAAPVRVRLAEQIRRCAAAWAIGSASAEEIGRFNLFHAGRLAMRRAVVALRPAPDALLVDAREVPGWPGPQTSLVRGDQLSYSVAAASILAKTARDAFMVRLDLLYPGYGFADHKGYGVPRHQAALRALGPCPAHRATFDAVARCGED